MKITVAAVVIFILFSFILFKSYLYVFVFILHCISSFHVKNVHRSFALLFVQTVQTLSTLFPKIPTLLG